MSENIKKLHARQQQMCGTTSEYDNSTFKPSEAEIIVYSDKYTDEGKLSGFRFKVGDGEHTADELPFYDSYINELPLLNDIGGIKASRHQNGFNMSIKELLDELLYPYTVPTISGVSISDGGGVFEKGTTRTIKNITFIVTRMTNEFTASYKIGNGEQVTLALPTPSGREYTYIVSNESGLGQLNSDGKVNIYVNDGESTVTSSTNYTFVYPYYYGVIGESESITEQLIKSGTRDVKAKGNKTYKFTTDNQRPFIAYPSLYGNLKEIIDPNNFAQGWKKSTIKILSNKEESFTYNGTDGVEYNVYIGDAATATNIEYDFKY